MTGGIAQVALPVLTRQLVDRKLVAFYERRLPPHVRGEIQLLHTVRGNTVTMIEARPYFRNPSEWTQSRMAQFRYDSETRNWKAMVDMGLLVSAGSTNKLVCRMKETG